MIFDDGFDPNRHYLYAQYPHGVYSRFPSREA